MAPQLPKLSQLTKMLMTPEMQFEQMVKSAGIELPPGPQSVLYKLQTSFELGETPSFEELMPKAPKIEDILGRLPKLPPLPSPFETKTEEIEGTRTTGSSPPVIEEKEVRVPGARILL